jgi:hypothetical protein
MTHTVMGDLRLQFNLQLWPLWPWSNQTHLAFEYGNKLWELIKSELAEPLASARDPLIPMASPLGPVGLGFRPHAA